MRVWTNAEGQEMRAAVQKTDADNVTFQMAGGRVVVYQLQKLSEESRKAIAEAAKAQDE